MKYVIIALVGFILALGLMLFFSNQSNKSLNKMINENKNTIQALNTKVKNLDDAVKAANQSDDKIVFIEDRLAQGIKKVDEAPKTSTCGPSVDAAIDQLRDNDKD